MKKRCLALILAIMLCIGILPTPALAEGEGATDGEVSPDYTYMYPDGKSAIPDDMDDGEEGTPVEGAANFAPYVVSKEKVSVSVPTANTSLSVRRLTAPGPDTGKGGEVENGYNTGSVNSNVTRDVLGNGTQEASSKDTQETSANVPQEASGNGTQEVSANVPQEASGNGTQEVLDNGTQDVFGNLTQEVLDNGTQEVSGNGTQEVSGNGTQEVSGNGTQEVSGNGTQEVSGNGTQEVLGNSTQEVLTNGTQEASGTDAPVIIDDHTQEAPVNGTSGTNNTSSEAVIDQFDLSTLEVNIEGGNAFTYTGSPIEPAVTALNLPTNLTSEDYSVSYGENTDAGTSAGSIRITAASNRTIGSRTVYFDIEPRNVSDAVVTGIDDPTSSALATEDTVAAAVDNRKLTWGVDAELSVQDNVPGSGNCTVTITGKNNYTGTWSRVYGLFSEAVLQQIDLADVTVTIVDGNSFIYTGSQIRPEVQVSDLTTEDYSVSYGDNIGVGTAAGSITIEPCSNKTNGSQTVHFDIEPRSISGAVVTLSSASDTYDGADKKPTVEKVVLGDTELGTGDYFVSYAPETAWIGAGEYDVTVGGQGNYTGTVPATFTISPASIADGYIEGLSWVIDVADVTADSFDVVVGTKTLATGEYSFSAQASGTIVTVTVTGQGNYTGSFFEEYARAMPLSEADVTMTNGGVFTYTGSPVDLGLAVTFDGEPLQENEDYVLPSSLSLVDAGNYTVELTTIEGGRTYGSKALKIQILPRSLADSTLEGVTAPTTKAAVEANLKVKVGGRELTGEEYDLTVAEGTLVIAVTVTGKGNYEGTLSANYTRSINLDDTDVTMNNGGVFTYTGSPVDLGLVVTTGDVTLNENEDYVLPSSLTLVEMGNYTVELTPGSSGRTYGSKTFLVRIVSASMGDAAVTLAADSFTYTGSPIVPGVTVKMGDATLIENADYTVTCTNNTYVGTAHVKIASKAGGRVTGEKELTFAITPRSLADCTVGPLPDVINSAEWTDELATLTFNGATLRPGTDWTVTVTDNPAAGVCELVFSGSGNFTGEKRPDSDPALKTYDLTQADVTVVGAPFTYSGTAFDPEVEVSVGGRSLEADYDYQVTGAAQTDVGEYNLTLMPISQTAGGSGLAIGSKTVSYTIARRSIADGTVEGITSPTTKAAVETNLVVKVDGQTLEKSRDYYTLVLTYGTTLQVTVKGQGNYEGSFSVTYDRIVDLSEPGVVISIDGASGNTNSTIGSLGRVYSGEAFEPSIGVRVGGQILRQGTDYLVSYANNTNAGTGIATVKAGPSGVLSGERSVTFTIRKGYIPDGTLEGVTAPTTKAAVEANLKVKVHGRELTGEDYDLTVVEGTLVIAVTVTGKGNYEGTLNANYTRSIDLSEADVTMTNGGVFTYTGSPVDLGLAVTFDGEPLQENEDYVLPSTLSLVDAGNYTVELTTIEGGRTYGSKALKIQILPRSLADGTLEGVTAPTTKAAVEANLKVKVGDRELTGEEYDLTVAEETLLIAVTVTGKGNYEGTLNANYTRSINLDDTDVTVTIGGGLPGGGNGTGGGTGEFVYTGKPICPNVTVQVGNQSLKQQTDYDVNYGKNTDVGTGSVIVVPGLSRLINGTKTFHFAISALSINHGEIEGLSSPLNITALHENAFTVIVNGRTLTEGKDFDWTAQEEGDQVVVTVTGKGNYKDQLIRKYTSLRSLIVDLGSQVTVAVSGLPGGNATGGGTGEFVYTGEQIQLAIEVNAGNRTLEQGKDYTVTYGDNTEAGTGTVTITPGTNSLINGTKTITFTIAPRTIEDGEIEGLSSPLNITALHENAFTVIVNGRTLTEGKDFDWTAREEGDQVVVTVTGKGNYKDTLVCRYTAAKTPIISLNDENITVTLFGETAPTGGAQSGGPVFIYTGQEIQPGVNVTFQGNSLQRDTDYAIAFTNNTNAGTGHVILGPGSNGHFNGSRIIDFLIGPRSIINGTVEDIGGPTNSTSILQKGVIVVVNGRTLILGKDFLLSAQDLTDAGICQVSISGVGNYEGELQVNCTLTTSAPAEEPDAPNLLQVTLERLSEVAVRLVALLESKNGDSTEAWDVLFYPNGITAENASTEPNSSTNPNGFLYINTLTQGAEGETGSVSVSEKNGNISSVQYGQIIDLGAPSGQGSLKTNSTYGVSFREGVKLVNGTFSGNATYSRPGSIIYVRIPDLSEGNVTFTVNGEVKNGGQSGNTTQATDISNATVTGLDPSKETYTEAEIEMLGLEGLLEDVDFSKTVTVETDESGQAWWVVTFSSMDGTSQKTVRLKQAADETPRFAANCETLGHDRDSLMKILGRFVKDGQAITCYEVTYSCRRCGMDLGMERFIVTTNALNNVYEIVPGRDVNITEEGDGLRFRGEPAAEGDVFEDGKVLKSLDEVLVKGTRYDYAKLADEGCLYRFTDAFLTDQADGEYELLVLNGNQYWPVIVTVRDHRFTAVRAAELPPAPEMTEEAYEAWRLTAGVVKEYIVGSAQ